MTKQEFIKTYKHFKDIDANIEADLDSVITSEIESRMPSEEEKRREQSEYLTDKEERAFHACYNWLKNKLK